MPLAVKVITPTAKSGQKRRKRGRDARHLDEDVCTCGASKQRELDRQNGNALRPGPVSHEKTCEIRKHKQERKAAKASATVVDIGL